MVRPTGFVLNFLWEEDPGSRRGRRGPRAGMGSRGGLRGTRGSPPRFPSQEGLAAQRGWRGAVRGELLQLQSILLLKRLSFPG